MTFSKLIPVLCALGASAIGFTAQAEDNPAQAAARMALAKQLFEISGTNSAPAAAANVPTEADQKLAAQQAAAAQAASAQAQVKANADKAGAAPKAQADSTADADRAALAAALDARMKSEAATKNAAGTVTNSVAPVVTSTSAKPTKGKQTKPAPTAAAAPPTSSKPGNTYSGEELGLKAIAPPPVPISSSKADRLASLLEKYRADQITPEEYHQQRAAILAEP